MKGIYWRTLTFKKSVIYLIKVITHRTITRRVIVHGRASCIYRFFPLNSFFPLFSKLSTLHIKLQNIQTVLS